MFRRLFSIGGALLVTGAMVVLTVGSSQAAPPHGGHHGGGWHGGGGYRGGYYDGYRGYGYRPFYGSYFGYPYYDGYLGYGRSSWWSPSYYYTPSYTVPYEDVTPISPSDYTPAAPAVDTAAHLTIRAPANATVWVGGWRTPNTGSIRRFDSPPLTPGKQYSYEVKAQWEENGRMVTQTQEVDVSAGARAEAVFPVVTPGAASQASGTAP